MYYLLRLCDLTLCNKEDVGKAFAAMGDVSKSSYEAFSKFLTFLEKTKELDEFVVKLRKAMPKKPTQADTCIPPDSLILRVRKPGSPYTLIHNILVSAG